MRLGLLVAGLWLIAASADAGTNAIVENKNVTGHSSQAFKLFGEGDSARAIRPFAFSVTGEKRSFGYGGLSLRLNRFSTLSVGAGAARTSQWRPMLALLGSFKSSRYDASAVYEVDEQVTFYRIVGCRRFDSGARFGAVAEARLGLGLALGWQLAVPWTGTKAELYLHHHEGTQQYRDPTVIGFAHRF